MPTPSNFFLPPSAHSFNTFDTTELQNVLEDYEDGLSQYGYSERHDHLYTQLQPLAEAAAESSSSPAVTSDTSKTPTSRDAIKLSSRSHSSRSNRRSKKQTPGDSTSGVKRCHLCGVTDTPRWRTNSAGAGLLCNVCGLVQTKRISRKNLTVSRESTSTRSSSHR
ncbi:hypothetical protein LB507_002292 [Fusarium sp. FIESC RH6]|nr:hypothetical protein LB507_002292 [Fusarium sp. FIESC RH6]